MDWNLVKRVSAYTLVFLIMASPLLVLAQGGGLVPCGEKGDPCTFNDIIALVNTIINFLIKFVAIPISTILFAWAGFLYLTAAGNPTQIGKATTIFTDVFIGLALALSAWLVVNLVTNVLTGKNLNEFF
ncbi:MAG: hypothetical protein AMXMBFR44_5900 [Candidatus Campbellbacteria bacterium]